MFKGTIGYIDDSLEVMTAKTPAHGGGRQCTHYAQLTVFTLNLAPETVHMYCKAAVATARQAELLYCLKISHNGEPVKLML